jgi:polyhydroxybutyrate depolymerase
MLITVKRTVELFFLVVLTHATAPAESKMMTWTIDGLKREAIVYLPAAKSPGGKAPLVFSFHGHGDNIQNFQQVDLQAAWPEAIVAYFQGLPTSRSNEPPLPGWQVQTATYGDRDLKLVDTALASLRKQYKVDDARIYATGFSNGANFTYLLWAERPNVFAAYAPVAAVLRASPKTPRPILHIAGVRDSTIRFDNQKETMETVRKINGATGKGEACGVGCTLYNPSSGAPVMTWIHQGGHDYPEGTSERIVMFFKQYPMNGPGVTLNTSEIR